MFEMQPPRPLGGDFTTAIMTRVGLDRYMVGSSRLGAVFVGWTGRGITAVRRADGPDDEAAFVNWYRGRTGRRVVRAMELDELARAAQAKVEDSSAPDVPLDLEAATPFERAVLSTVTEIRHGYARPYELIARELERSHAPESVAEILAANPLPLIVPCHRVVSEKSCCHSNYVFGADAQRRLLEAEGLDADAVDRVIARGYRYIENEGWFCLPTCGDVAMHLDRPGFGGLHSLDEARERGLRPCESCRPVAA